MRNVRFEFAGRANLQEVPFLMSRDRRKKAGRTIYHRNDFHTVLLIPLDIFRAVFSYERFSGIYRTCATYHELTALGAKIETMEL